MGEHTRIRRRVGGIVMAVGGLTLAYMIAANTQGWPALSLVNLLTLPLGAALLVGTLSTVRAMTWCIALYLTLALGIVIGMPFIESWAVTKASLRAEPVANGVRYGYQILLVGLLIWAYRRLRQPALLAAMHERRIRTGRPWVALGVGGLLLVGWVALEYQFRYSEEAVTARSQARLVHGVDRVYRLTRLIADDERGVAVFEAYGPNGVETVAVDWGGLPPIDLWASPANGACAADEGDREPC